MEAPTMSPPLLEYSGFNPESVSVVCRARNAKCCSLVGQADLTVMPCNFCCVEPGFCGDCCCILCNKFIDLNYGGYSYIKCEATVSEGYICGHVAHLNCALRCYLAGTIGGSIGLDAEYHCRCCDARTDLILHVLRFLQTCESVDSRNEVQKILNIGVCILRGSQKTSAKELLNRIELAIKKLKRGNSLRDIVRPCITRVYVRRTKKKQDDVAEADVD